MLYVFVYGHDMLYHNIVRLDMAIYHVTMYSDKASKVLMMMDLPNSAMVQRPE